MALSRLDTEEQFGIACGCSACLGGMAGTAAGIATWIVLIWPAMERNSDLSGIGKWLMTFLGPGEAYVSAWAAAGACVFMALGGCVTCCLKKNDLEPADLELSVENSAEVQQAMAIIEECMKNAANETSEFKNADLDTQVDSIVKTLIEKNLIKANEAEVTRDNIKKFALEQSQYQQNQTPTGFFGAVKSYVSSFFYRQPAVPVLPALDLEQGAKVGMSHH